MATGSFPNDYAGDLSPSEAWSLMNQQHNAQLVDVRSSPEWTFVGMADPSSLGRQTICVEWQKFPSMAVNALFVEEVEKSLEQAGLTKDTPLLFLCRSGARSRAAAIAMTAAGYRQSYNIAGGFEGDLDGERHRGSRNGWKAAGLPWKQT